MEHSLNVEVAKIVGVYEALFLHNIKFWTLTNLANKRHIIDRLCWTYNTIEAFSVIFPYFNPRQIRHITDKLVDSDYLAKGNYNESRYDKKTWWALLPKSYALYPELCRADFYELLFNSPLSGNKTASDSICQICQMGKTDLSLLFPKIVTCTNTDNKPYKKPDKAKAYEDKKMNNELKQTAKFWGPGHPDYDRNNH